MRTLLTMTLTAALVAFGVGMARGQSAPVKDEKKVAEQRLKAAEEALKAAQLQANLQAALKEAEAVRQAEATRQATAKAEQEKRMAEERKAAEEKLRYAQQIHDAHRKLQAELEARTAELRKLQEQRAAEESKKVIEAYKEAATLKFKSPESPRTPVVQPPPAPPVLGVRRVVAEPTPSADPIAAIKLLVLSEDPKVAALAKQLVEAMATQRADGQTKKAPQSKPPVPAVASGRLVLTAESEKRPVVVTQGEPLKVFVNTEKIVKVPESYSNLRMSADGKTAAVIAADGSVTVFDTVSGKELMKFPVKK